MAPPYPSGHAYITNTYIFYPQQASHLIKTDNKKAAPTENCFYLKISFQSDLLRKRDRLVRANIRTCAALRAHIRVNVILVPFRDCSYRTFINARSACYAVVANYVSHTIKCLKY